MADTLNNIKETLCGHIDSRRRQIAALGEDLFNMPEMGYNEYESSAYVYDKLVSLCGAEQVEKDLAVTGVKAVVDIPERARAPWLGGIDGIALYDRECHGI